MLHLLERSHCSKTRLEKEYDTEDVGIWGETWVNKAPQVLVSTAEDESLKACGWF